MTIRSLNQWKTTGKTHKIKLIKEFYKTNPTDKQEELRSKITIYAYYLGTFFGMIFGFCIALLVI
jgi:hypothetical protein